MVRGANTPGPPDQRELQRKPGERAVTQSRTRVARVDGHLHVRREYSHEQRRSGQRSRRPRARVRNRCCARELGDTAGVGPGARRAGQGMRHDPVERFRLREVQCARGDEGRCESERGASLGGRHARTLPSGRDQPQRSVRFVTATSRPVSGRAPDRCAPQRSRHGVIIPGQRARATASGVLELSREWRGDVVRHRWC